MGPNLLDKSIDGYFGLRTVRCLVQHRHWEDPTGRTHDDKYPTLRQRKDCREPESLGANAKVEVSERQANSDGQILIPSSNCPLFWFLI